MNQAVSRRLSRINLWYYFAIALLLRISTEYAAYTEYGQFFHCIFLFVIICVSVKNARAGFFVFISWLLFTASYPRGLYIEEVFYSFITTEFFGISLLNITIMFFFILIIKKNYGSKLNKYKALVLITLATYISYSVLRLLCHETTVSNFSSDIIYLAMLLSGIVSGYYFMDTSNTYLLLKVFFIISFLIIPFLFIINLFVPIPGFYGYILSYDSCIYLFPTIIVFLFSSKERKFRKVLYLILLSTYTILQPFSSLYFFSGVSFVICLIWKTIHHANLVTMLKLVAIAIVFLIALVSLNNFKIDDSVNYFNELEQLFSFNSMKLDLQSAYELPHSFRVRVLEILNIYSEIKGDILTLIFGKGIGATYSDSKYYIPSLNYSDYSKEEILNRRFSFTHTSIGYTLLKFGVIGLLFLLIVLIIVILRIFQEKKLEKMFLLMVLLFQLIAIGYSNKNGLLTGIVFSVVLMK